MTVQAYRKVHQHLRRQILDGGFGSGDQLPTERELCERFSVSRITVRDALQLLEEQGLIDRQVGRGTFVRHQRPRKLPILNADYTGSMRAEAPGLERLLLEHAIDVPPAHIAAALGLIAGEECLYASRLDVLDGDPLARDQAWIPLQYASRIDDAMLVRIDFLQVWMEAERLPDAIDEESIEAVDADAETARILRVSPGSPVLLTSDLIRDSRDGALALFDTYYRADRFRLVSVMRVPRR